MRRNMLGKQQQFVNHIVRLMKEVSQFSGNRNRKVSHLKCHVARCSGLVICMLDSGLICPGWSDSWNHCVCWLDTTLVEVSFSCSKHCCSLFVTA